MNYAYLYAFKYATQSNISSEEKFNIIKDCIVSGIDVNCNNSQILIDAIQDEDIKIINLLIDNGIDICANDNRALCIACQNDNLEIVKILLSVGANANSETKPPILQTDNIDIIKLLIGNGADPHVKSDKLLSSFCSTDDNLEIVEYLLSIGLIFSNKLIFHIFSSVDNPKIKRLLLENGADPNEIKRWRAGRTNTYYDINLLEYTIMNSDYAGCKLLFEYSADINQCYNIINKNYNELDIHNNRNDIELIIELIIELFMTHGLDICEFVDKIK